MTKLLKFASLSVICFSLLFLTSGCLFTRFAEKVYSIGCTEYYADGSDIRGSVLYKLDDKHYIYARETAYVNSPDWYGFAMHPKNKISFLHKTENYVLVSLTPEAVENLLGDESKENRLQSQFYGEVCEDVIDLSQAEIIPIKRDFYSPWVISMCCGDMVTGARYIRTEKSGLSWLAAPLMIPGLAVDVPIFIANVGIVIVVWPIILPIQWICKSI